MSYTREDLESALKKVTAIEFTEAEAEAMACALASSDDEVTGFASFAKEQNEGYLVHVSKVQPSEENGGNTGLRAGPPDMFNLGFKVGR